MEEETITNELSTPHQMTLPMKKIRVNEIKNVTKVKSIPKRLQATIWSAEKSFRNFPKKAFDL